MSQSSWLAWQMDTNGICDKHGALLIFILDADGFCPACKADQQNAQLTGGTLPDLQALESMPTRQDLLDAWAAYEAARNAAEAGGWEYDLSMAAADAAKVYYRLNREIAEKGVRP